MGFRTIQNPTIYCDMDGVLVELEDSLLELMNGAVINNQKFPPEERDLIVRAVKSFTSLPIDSNFSFKPQHMKKESSKPEIEKLALRLMRKNRKFWSSLPRKHEGIKLWNFLAAYPNVHILTIPVDEECKKGKCEWVERYLGLSEERILFSDWENKKGEYGNKNSILIDDNRELLAKFQEAGGHGILFTSFGLALPELLNLLPY